MTDYAIRIIIQNKQHLENIKEYLKQYPLLISPIEIGCKTKKEHIHIYLKTEMKKNTLVKNMKTVKLLQTGNRSYSWVQIVHKEPYKDLEESINIYKAYCIKTGSPYYTNINILGLPKWLPKYKLQQEKNISWKQQLRNNYTIMPKQFKTKDQIRIQIISYIINQYTEADKPFTSSTVKMYCNYILSQFYPSLIDVSELYCEWFKYNETGIF